MAANLGTLNRATSKETQTMNTKHIAAVVAAASLTLSAFAGTTAVKPKITMEQARATALKKAPGKVKSAELENEHGKLIYSFDIATSKNAITEVNAGRDAQSSAFFSTPGML